MTNRPRRGADLGPQPGVLRGPVAGASACVARSVGVARGVGCDGDRAGWFIRNAALAPQTNDQHGEGPHVVWVGRVADVDGIEYARQAMRQHTSVFVANGSTTRGRGSRGDSASEVAQLHALDERRP